MTSLQRNDVLNSHYRWAACEDLRIAILAWIERTDDRRQRQAA